MRPVPPEFEPVSRFGDTFSNPYRYGSVDYAEMGRHSPGGRPPLDTPVTDYFLGEDSDRPGLRAAERVMRDMGRGVVMGGPEMVAAGLGNLEGAVDEGSVSRGAGALGQIGLGAVSPVLPALRPFQRAFAARPVATSVGTGATFGGASVLAEPGSASAQAPAAAPDTERARTLATEVSQLGQQAEAARQLRERNRPAGVGTPSAKHTQFHDADAEYRRLIGEQNAARVLLKAEMDKGTPEYRAREAAQGDRERQVREAVAARDKLLGEAPRPFQQEFGATGRQWPLAPVVLGGLTGLALALPGTISQRANLSRWNRALSEAQGIPHPSVMQRLTGRAPGPVAPERQATAMETARRYAERDYSPGYLAGYGLPVGLGAVEGAGSVFLPNYYNMTNLPSENPEWTALQAEYRNLPEGHPRREQLKRMLEDETTLTRRNLRQQQAEEFFSTGRWMPAMGGAAAEGATMGAIGATAGRLARPYGSTWNRMRDETHAIVDPRPPPGPRGPEPTGPSGGAGSSSPTPPPPAELGLARLPLPEGGPGSGTPPRGPSGPTSTGTGPRPIEPLDNPPVPTGASSPPVIVRGTDRLGRRYHYDPATGHRTSGPRKPNPDDGNRDGGAINRRRGGVVERALAVARKYADGGAVW
jgi:hypothetical protein